MNKFFALLRKEIQELLTWQVILPLLVVVLIFSFIGDLVNRQAEEAAKETNIAVLDLDRSDTTTSLISLIEESGSNIEVYENETVDTAKERLKTNEENSLLVFPPGFEKGLQSGEPQNIEIYTNFENLSFIANANIGGAEAIIGLINQQLSNQLILEEIKDADIAFLKQPVGVENTVLVHEMQARVNPNEIMGFISSQTTFIPIVLFLIITFSSQLVATGIASEKENKTLETLLSAPISRKSIVAAKLMGAGIVSGLAAVVYIIGMRNYMGGLTAGFQDGPISDISPVLSELGLTFDTVDYVLLGVSLFFGIMVALSIAFILGALAKDTKSAQTVMAPLMVSLLIPYFLTLFLDISELPAILKYIVYAIPFTHTFTATPNILLGNYTAVIWGNVYLAALFIITIFTAGSFFSSEKILTMQLRFGKKK